MASIACLRIRNYRSIESLDLVFPRDQPLVLLGENNAGKSNIVKALELLLGPIWPGNHEAEDHEFYQRDSDRNIQISAEFDRSAPMGRYTEVKWTYDSDEDPPTQFGGFPPPYPNYPHGFISRADRDAGICIVLHAERDLDYQLSYRSKWTFLSRLMHRFHRALGSNEDVKQRLADLFASIRFSFGEIPEFKTFVEELQQQVKQLAGSMTHRLEVDFEAYNPANFFHALRLGAVEGTNPRSLDELGTGEQQILAIAFAYAFAKAFHGGVFLVIEEPESHLHPLAQDWLARRLTSMARDELQILITTHSPAFVELAALEGIALVTKGTNGTTVSQVDRAQLVRHCETTGVPAGRSTVDNILPFYSATATREILEGFFSKMIVLVEGPTEALALPVLLEKCGVTASKEGIAIIPVQGKGNLAKWNRLFGAYGIPRYLIFDNDPHDDGSGAKRCDALRSQGVAGDVASTLISAQEWVVEADYCIFGTKYETAMRAFFEDYATLENAARESGIDSKPFVARWVAGKLEYDPASSGWAKLGMLADALRAKIPRDSSDPVGAQQT